jgi:hypothetical protein
VSGISTVAGTAAALSDWGIVGIAVGGAAALVAASVASVVWCRRRARRSADNFSNQVSGSLGYLKGVDAPEEAALSGDKAVSRDGNMARDEPAGSPEGRHGMGLSV